MRASNTKIIVKIKSKIKRACFCEEFGSAKGSSMASKIDVIMIHVRIKLSK